MAGWTRARRRRVGWFALLFALCAAAVMVAYALPWFVTSATATVSGASAADSLTAAFATSTVGHVGPLAPAVPTLAGVPAATVLLVCAALAGLGACAGRNAVLFVPAVLLWVCGSAMAQVTARAFSWAPVGPATEGVGWKVMSAASTLMLVEMLVAAVFVAKVNHSARRAAGAGPGAALAGLETVLLRGAASRSDAAGSQAAMAAERTDHP